MKYESNLKNPCFSPFKDCLQAQIDTLHGLLVESKQTAGRIIVEHLNIKFWGNNYEVYKSINFSDEAYRRDTKSLLFFCHCLQKASKYSNRAVNC